MRKVGLIKARFFTEEEIEKAKMENLSIAHSLQSPLVFDLSIIG